MSKHVRLAEAKMHMKHYKRTGDLASLWMAQFSLHALYTEEHARLSV